MTLEESIKIREKIATRDALTITDEDLQAIQDSVADPTGLMPFMKERIEQASDLSSQIEAMQQDLQQTRQQMAKQQAEYDKRRESDALQRTKDKKQSFRHDFYVAAFSVAFTLLVERFSDIVAFIQKFIS